MAHSKRARLAVATANAHKVEEIWAILTAEIPGLIREDLVDVRSLGAPSPVEDGVTFEENALIKARALAESSGLPAIADDSGIAVDVMGGAPGIFSAKWAGTHGEDAANLALLLAQMDEVRDQDRSASFVCAAALVIPGGGEVVRIGRMAGRLVRESAGAGGFGYDPAFVPDGHELTAGELSPEAKNAISHRGAAFRALAPDIAAVL